LDEDRAELELIEAKLENDEYAVDLREQLAELDAQQSELGYDETSHDDAKELLESKKQYEELNTRLKIALESLPTLEKSLHEAQARQDRLQKAYGETEAEIAAFDSTIIELTALVEEYNARNSEVMAQRTQERSAYERVVSAKRSLDALDAQETRKAELEERRDNSRHQEAIYNELKRAFGKNGIPAMVIETAIPELETTANRLLSRMTDGRMHLSLNTQREKITGGIAETLDIEIADELGTRSYEMYSGGEAFRINFAIRVALSQMLARRAGAHLRTLFIDEGFGTQDEDGRSKLVEAINTIQEEFSLILVITHIDELRDSFPVHIVVEKTSSGSRVQVV
jgi:exonuclease SbcC